MGWGVGWAISEEQPTVLLTSSGLLQRRMYDACQYSDITVVMVRLTLNHRGMSEGQISPTQRGFC